MHRADGGVARLAFGTAVEVAGREAAASIAATARPISASDRTKTPISSGGTPSRLMASIHSAMVTASSSTVSRNSDGWLGAG